MNCEECRIGRYQKTYMPYLAWMGDQIMVVSKATVYICDVCRKSFYDPEFMKNIHYMMEYAEYTVPSEGKPPLREESTLWPASRSSL